ncbi:hypothetical protein [Nocardiopsis halophila]|uniref:hypothetical protein n=1 Tax=Nocardiopsis halophila TaxID=141692 RepID=UPI000349CCA0|nr:hypothetical protein [Nocardiopsis halophila]
MELPSLAARVWRKREYAVALSGVFLLAIGLSQLGGPEPGWAWYPLVGGGVLLVGVPAKLAWNARRTARQGRNGPS